MVGLGWTRQDADNAGHLMRANDDRILANYETIAAGTPLFDSAGTLVGPEQFRRIVANHKDPYP